MLTKLHHSKFSLDRTQNMKLLSRMCATRLGISIKDVCNSVYKNTCVKDKKTTPLETMENNLPAT